MNDYKTIKFNGNLYPYLELDIYDYTLNKTDKIKVGTVDLYNDITNSLLSNNKQLYNNAKNFDPNFKRFIPKSMILKSKPEFIVNKLQSNQSIVLN